MQLLTQGEYFGALRRELFHRGINLSEYDYLEPGTPLHYHENPYFMYVIDGQMMDVSKYGSGLLPPGSLMFLNWEETHRTEKHSRRGRGFHLQVDRAWLAEVDVAAELWEGNRRLHHPDLHLLLGKIYLEFRRADAFSALSIELLVLQLCSLLTEMTVPAGNPPPWIDKLVELFHARGESLTLADLSRELGVHPVHISRTVPLFLGNTVGEYLRKQRVSRALSALLQREESLTQVAYDAGFADQSHFTRVFRTYYGTTPARFRKATR